MKRMYFVAFHATTGKDKNAFNGFGNIEIVVGGVFNVVAVQELIKQLHEVDGATVINFQEFGYAEIMGVNQEPNIEITEPEK